MPKTSQSHKKKSNSGKESTPMKSKPTNAIVPEEDDVCIICEDLCANSACLRCIKCDKWLHACCLDADMPAAMADYLSAISRKIDNRDYPMKIMCMLCSSGMQSVSLDRLTQLEHSLESRLSKLEAAVLGSSSTKAPAAVYTLKTSASSATPICQASLAEEIKKVLQDQHAEETRSRSLIISGFQECDHRNDTEEVIGMIHSVTGTLLDKVDLAIVERIGKRSIGPSARPLRIVFGSKHASVRRDFLSKQKDIRETDDTYFQQVYVNPDKTREELHSEYLLRQELKQRVAKGESNLKISKGKIVSKVAPTVPVN